MAVKHWAFPSCSADINTIKGIIEKILPKYDRKEYDYSKTSINLLVDMKKEGLYKGKADFQKKSTETLGRAFWYELEMLGLVCRGKKIYVSDLGKEFLENHEETLRKQLLKWQIWNPTNKFDKKLEILPFRTTLQLLKELNYLTTQEIQSFVLSIKNKNEIKEYKEKILQFRKTQSLGKGKVKPGVVLATMYNHAKRLIFFMKEMGLCESEDEKLKIKQSKIKEVENILNEKVEYIRFETKGEWFEYYADLNKNLFEEKKETKTEKRIKPKIPRSLDDVINGLSEVKNLEPYYLEWYLSHAFDKIGFIVKWGEPSKNLNEIPKSWTSRGKADVKIEDKELPNIIFLIEATLKTDRQQFEDEKGIKRHIDKEQRENPNKEIYCLFIAPSIHEDTTSYMHFQNEKMGYKYAPITIDDFKTKILSNFSETKATLEDFSRLKKKEFTHRDFYRVIDDVVWITRKDGSNYTKWNEEINKIFEKLMNKS